MTFRAQDLDYAQLLDPVHSALTDQSCAALSLDVFDTILWRRVPRPTDLFALLGAKLRHDGRCPEWVSESTFRQLRIDAEAAARSSKYAIGVETSLSDIWRFMPTQLFGGLTREELVEAEVGLERSMTVVDLNISAVIKLADKHGVPIVLVSDTYFTDEQLRYLVDRPELEGLASARIFRSHEYGTGKGTGLWKIVLNDLGLQPEQVIHIGDHQVADHDIPSKLGVRAVHYVRIDDGFADILQREQEPTTYAGPFSPLIDLEHGDFGITSLRAKAILSAMPRSSSGVTQAWRYGAGVLGPVLTGFAEWVASKAQAEGTPVLWCPMREGEMLSTLINNAAQARGWEVSAQPVWLSRHVVALASLDSFDAAELCEFVRRPYRPTVRQLLGMLYLRPGEVPALADKLDVVVDSVSVAELVSAALTESAYLRNRLAVSSTRARDRLLASLRQSGALDGPQLTLVDLGWGGTIQFLLTRVLRLAQLDIRVAGLYLATNEGSLRLIRQGARAEGYLGEAGYPREVVSPIARSPEVLEQIVNSHCGSLTGFAEGGEPVLGPCSAGPVQQAEHAAARAGIYRFQELWNSHVRLAAGDWPTLVDTARARLANILVTSVSLPTAPEAALFGSWSHEENLGSNVVTRNLPEHLVPVIPYLSPNDLHDLNMRDVFWPALIAASNLHLGAAAHALSTGLVSSAMFEQSGTPPETRLRYLTKDGKWHRGPRRPVRINHDGLSFAQMTFDATDATTLSLAIPGRRAIVRIDWIEARALAGGGSKAKVLRWETSEDFAALVYVGAKWHGGKLVEFNRANSAVQIPLTTWSGGRVTSAQVTMGFAVLPYPTARLRKPPAPAPAPPPQVAPMSRRLSRARKVFRTQGAAALAAGAARAAARELRKRS